MIDTSIQLNNHNSYHATELFWADTFSVQTMSHITASFALYSDVVQAAADRIKIRFYTASGATVSETNHAFAVNTIWERVSVTVAVPATAEKAQICFLAGSYWWAEAKVEEGQTATPYAINAAGQLTWISPNGIYTGTVTAQQVIVSPLSGATEKDLESRLVTINSNAINLKATTDNNVSRLTTIEAGQITLESRVDGVEPKVTKITSAGVYTGEVVASQMTTGILKSLNGYSQLNLDNGTFNFGNGALAWNGSSLTAKGSFESVGGTQSAKIDQGSVRLANNGVELGYFSVQSAEPTGPYITAAESATKIKLGKVVGGGIYNGLLLDWGSPTGTTARAYINGGEICHIGGAALQCGGIGPVTSSAWVQVTFPKPFPGPPVVLVAPELSEEGVSAPKIRNVTATGFQVTIGGTGTTAPSVNWIAMQY
jgi:hypothetical protein